MNAANPSTKSLIMTLKDFVRFRNNHHDTLKTLFNKKPGMLVIKNVTMTIILKMLECRMLEHAI